MPDFQVILSVDISIDIEADDAGDAETVAHDSVNKALRGHCAGARVPSIRTIDTIGGDDEY